MLNKSYAPTRNNPLIETHPADTLSRASAACAFVQEAITLRENTSSDGLSPKARTGLFFIMQCVTEALDYESQHTQRTKDVSDV